MNPYANPYATTFGRVHLLMYLLFIVTAMALAVCRRINEIIYDGTDKGAICIAVMFFLSAHLLSITCLMISTDWSLSSGAYGARQCS